VPIKLPNVSAKSKRGGGVEIRGVEMPDPGARRGQNSEIGLNIVREEDYCPPSAYASFKKWRYRYVE